MPFLATPAELEREIRTHVRLAELVDTNEVRAMHRDIAAFQRAQLAALLVAEEMERIRSD